MHDWRARVRQRLAPLELDGAREAEIADEMAEHLEQRYQEMRATGVRPAEARKRVMAELAGSQWRQEMLDACRGIPPAPPIGSSKQRGGLVSNLVHDLKTGCRAIRQKPGFSLMVMGMLALGIAGNAAVFSIFDGLFLKSFPFREADRLVDLDETAPQWNLRYVGVANEDLFTWRSDNTTFEEMAFFRGNDYNLSGFGAAERIHGAAVTRGLLDVLKLKPVVGRNFTAEEDVPGGPKVAMISFALWQRIFQGDRSVPGRVIRLFEQPYTIVGVLPRETVLPDQADIWLPLAKRPTDHNGWYLSGIGRLKPGVTMQQATADLERIHRAMVPARPVNRITSPLLTTLRERYLGDLRLVGNVLLAAVGVVLLIACVNVAALMLVRGAARSREIAIRMAVGAWRGRIIRQLLSESLVLAAAGGAGGILLGAVCLRGIVALMPDVLPHWVTFGLDVRFLLFCAAVITAATLLSGVIPALQASSVDTQGALQDSGGRTSLSRRRQWTLRGLVVGEIGLALILLMNATLLVDAFRRVLKTDPGFRSENVLTFGIDLPNQNYPKDRQQLAFYRQLLERLRSLPGVQAAGAASAVPLSGQHWGDFYRAEGDRPLGPNEKNPVVLKVVASPGYFDAIGMTMLAGRQFEERDGTPADQTQVIVNESFARYHWPHAAMADVIGKRIFQDPAKPWPIIGVARDTKHYGLDQEMRGSVFFPPPAVPLKSMTVVLRSAVDPESLVGPARDVIRQLDPGLPMFRVRTMTEQVDRTLWARRAYSTLFVVFAAVALVLAAAGIYGVISYAVSQRTQEIGIRIALGARPGQVMKGVLGGGMSLVAMGSALGLAGTLLTSRLLTSLLFGGSARAGWIYAAVILGVAAVGGAANYVPARRAASVDPIRALRTE